MNAVNLSNAVSNMDKLLLDRMLEKRYRLMLQISEAQETKEKGIRALFANRKKALTTGFGIAAAIFLFILGGLFYRDLKRPNESETPHYVPAFSTPDLETLYRTEPFSDLLPRIFPLKFEVFKTYMTEEDPVIGGEKGDYLLVWLKSEDGTDQLEIRIGKIQNNEKMPPAGLVIPADDLTEEVVRNHVRIVEDAYYKGDIELLFGDRRVSYAYTGKTELRAEDFYNCITSAEYFGK